MFSNIRKNGWCLPAYTLDEYCESLEHIYRNLTTQGAFEAKTINACFDWQHYLSIHSNRSVNINDAHVFEFSHADTQDDPSHPPVTCQAKLFASQGTWGPMELPLTSCPSDGPKLLPPDFSLLTSAAVNTMLNPIARFFTPTQIAWWHGVAADPFATLGIMNVEGDHDFFWSDAGFRPLQGAPLPVSVYRPLSFTFIPRANVPNNAQPTDGSILLLTDGTLAKMVTALSPLKYKISPMVCIPGRPDQWDFQKQDSEQLFIIDQKFIWHWDIAANALTRKKTVKQSFLHITDSFAPGPDRLPVLWELAV